MKLIDIPTLYINLNKDENRKISLEKDLNKLNIEYNRVEAVYGKQLYNREYRQRLASFLEISEKKLHPRYWLDRHNFKTMVQKENAVLAKVGCYLSHLVSLKVALKLGYNKVLILEDDAMFLKNAYKEFNIPKNTDIYYPGGYFYKQGTNIKDNNRDEIQINFDKLKICGTYSYILPTRQKIIDAYNVYMAVFLDGKGHDKDLNWRSGKVRLRAQASDFVYINFFQKFGKCYIANPVMIGTRDFSSNIQANREEYQLSSYLNQKQQYNLIGVKGNIDGLRKIKD
tara:strand:+ start:263 stop:1114 length:852 start_codon:yes stop_codon:yes gene_type:complete